MIKHLVLVWAFCLLCGCGSDGDTSAVRPNHMMGDVWAMAYPTTIAGHMADHVYLQGLENEDGRLHHWMCFGRETVGEELADTRTDAWADLTVVGFMANEAPCKWPVTLYLRVGVCFQCANRGLYYTGKTVAASRGYNFFVTLYGTYGEETGGPYSMERCLATAPPWQGADLFDAPPSAMATTAAAPLSEEVSLYRTYVAGRHAGALRADDRLQWRRAYLDALFEQRVRLQLGADFCRQTLDALQSVRNAYLDEMGRLADWIDQAEPTTSEMRVAYEDLFNDLAARYRAYLTPVEYERLFQMDYDAPIDLTYYLP